MNTPQAARRRKSQVFVEIPPSPYSASSSKMEGTSHLGNTPLKAVVMNVNDPPTPPSTSSQLKRKTLEEPADMMQKDDAHAKKAKTENASKDSIVNKPSKSVKNTGKAGDAPKPEASLPRCHQCARLYDPEAVVHCTFKRRAGQRCVLRYCRACLRNRYGHNIEEIKSRAPSSFPQAEQDKHIEGTEYLYQCPRCCDLCNCRICRRAKGLPATGNLNLSPRTRKDLAPPAPGATEDDGPGPERNTGPSRQSAKLTPSSGKTPYTTGKSQNVAKAGAVSRQRISTQIKPRGSKVVPHVLVPPSPYKIKTNFTGSLKAKNTRPLKPTLQAPPKPMPKPMWSTLPTPLTFGGAVERMNIREFLLRFAHLADIARSHLEELEELATDDPYVDDDDASEGRLIGWIGEPALRAILIGLVTLFSKDAHEQDEATSVYLRAIQQLKGSGANLNKIWSALATLRDESDLDFPDPLPPPASATQRHTRSGSNDRDSVPVVTTSQLVPVVSALLENALRTNRVQEDFDRAAAQEKELSRAARDLSAAENARFRDLKAAKSESRGKAKKADKAARTGDQSKSKAIAGKIPLEVRRAAREAHDAELAKIDYAYRVASAECIPRFGPIGRDTEGRVYYAITPGVIERDAALDLLEGGKGEVKFSKKRVAELEDRKHMKHWSWFVAVYGRKPEGAEVAKLDGDGGDTEDQEDGAAERWWAFWQPEEVAKLAEWVAMKYGIDLDAKRISKSSEDSTVIDVDHTGHITKPADDKKSRGRPSNASSVASTSRPRKFASLNKDSSSDEEEFDSHGSDDDGDVQMRVDRRGEPVPTKNDLRALATGLKDYAELLEWRIKRATKGGQDGSGDKNDKVETALDKGKAVARTSEPIPPSTFYAN